MLINKSITFYLPLQIEFTYYDQVYALMHHETFFHVYWYVWFSALYLVLSKGLKGVACCRGCCARSRATVATQVTRCSASNEARQPSPWQGGPAAEQSTTIATCTRCWTERKREREEVLVMERTKALKRPHLKIIARWQAVKWIYLISDRGITELHGSWRCDEAWVAYIGWRKGVMGAARVCWTPKSRLRNGCKTLANLRFRSYKGRYENTRVLSSSENS